MTYTLCVPCLLGLEGPIADELRRLNMSDVRAENGRVYFAGSEIDIARANICLRQGERVMIELGCFEATDFDALYDGVRALPWESVIPADGAFPVKG
ncbi:MAG: class I SAM-dependent RNA methyltransferase, partial [Oscillospiraceae bacterium]|nr:class I SAM-dependent RNA methyltransferase [Oscillospiraceae bacterium]